MRRKLCILMAFLMLVFSARALAVEALVLPDADGKALIPVVEAYTVLDWLGADEEGKTRILQEMLTVFALDEGQALNLTVNMAEIPIATMIQDIDKQITGNTDGAFLETASIALSVALPAYARFGLVVGSYTDYFLKEDPLSLVDAVKAYTAENWLSADAEGKKRILQEMLTVFSLRGDQIITVDFSGVDAMIEGIGQTLNDAPDMGLAEAICAFAGMDIAFYIQFGMAPADMQNMFTPLPAVSLIPAVNGYDSSAWASADIPSREAMLRDILTVLSIDGNIAEAALAEGWDAIMSSMEEAMAVRSLLSPAEAAAECLSAIIEDYIPYGLLVGEYRDFILPDGYYLPQAAEYDVAAWDAADGENRKNMLREICTALSVDPVNITAMKAYDMSTLGELRYAIETYIHDIPGDNALLISIIASAYSIDLYAYPEIAVLLPE